MMEIGSSALRLVAAPGIAHDIGALLLERSQYVGPVAPTDRHPTDLHPDLMARVEAAVADSMPLTLVLPAFPAKSANRNKTISHLPDLGEVVALRYLDDLCRRIGEIHTAGARLVICADGRVFNDLVGVRDGDVDAYRSALAEIIAVEGFTHLSTYDLEDHYRSTSFETMREALLEDFAEALDAIRAQVLIDEDRRAMFNGIHRFLFEDRLAISAAGSRSRVREEAKALAYEVVQRSDAWSRLIAGQFPSAVRLSIHPHTRGSAKLGIKLVPGGGPWATPWHNCLVKDGDTPFLARQTEAIQRGAKLRCHKGRYSYYEL